VYLSFAQHPRRFMSLAARVRGTAPNSKTPQVPTAVSTADQDNPNNIVETHATPNPNPTWFNPVFRTNIKIFRGVALLHAALGRTRINCVGVGWMHHDGRRAPAVAVR
jgi:hypothetical protein